MLRGKVSPEPASGRGCRCSTTARCDWRSPAPSATSATTWSASGGSRRSARPAASGCRSAVASCILLPMPLVRLPVRPASGRNMAGPAPGRPRVSLEDVPFLRAIADQLVGAIHRAELFAQVEALGLVALDRLHSHRD